MRGKHRVIRRIVHPIMIQIPGGIERTLARE
jgi:hypothetical protein